MPVLDAREFQQEYDRIHKDATGVVTSHSPVSLEGDVDDSALQGNAEPDALQGSSTDGDLSPAARDAVQVALRALSPHAAHPGVGGMLGNLRSIAEHDKAERFLGDRGDDISEGTRAVEKCGTAALEMRTLLKKSDLPHGTREKVQRAAEHCEREYLLKHSVGAANAMASRARERGEGRLTPPPVI